MNVVVDTGVWSLALRPAGSETGPVATEVYSLVSEGRALSLGLVRLELLSGVLHARQFEELRACLRAFLDVEIDASDHEEAARYFNRCRSRGVQGSLVDLLICAVATKRSGAVFTMDRDFDRYARVLGAQLHRPRSGRE